MFLSVDVQAFTDRSQMRRDESGLNGARSGRFEPFRAHVGDASYGAGDPLDLVWLQPFRTFIEVVIDFFGTKTKLSI